MIMLSHLVKEKQVFGKKLATSPKWRKTGNKHTKSKQKKNIPLKRTQNMPRCNALPKMKFEFGTWGRTKDTKMKKKFIFKGKMHILRQRFSQMATIK